MANPPSSTMTAPMATNLSRANSTARTAPSTTPTTPVTKNLVTQNFNLMFRAFFPTPTAPAKLNPVTAMKNLFRVMLKDELSLVLRNAANDKQIELALTMIPTGENEFKKFFKVSTTRIEKQQQMHMCIGCHMLSNRTLGQIKFHSPDGNLLAWLKKECILLNQITLASINQ